MAGRLDRFLKLERRRPAGDEDPRLPSEAQRFRPAPDDPRPGDPPPDELASGTRATAGPAGHDPALERLRLARIERLASGVELDETSDATQPFCRCALCELDNNRAAVRCQNCGADLTTPDQVAFNARLWARHGEDLAREQAQLAALHGASAAAAPRGPPADRDPLGLRHAADLTAARGLHDGRTPAASGEVAGSHRSPAAGTPAAGARALGEALARQAAQEEQARLSSLEDTPWTSAWTRPLGWTVLEAIEPGWLRFAAGLCVVGFAALLLSLAVAERRTSNVGFNVPSAFLIALALLFLPRWRRRGLFGWWR